MAIDCIILAAGIGSRLGQLTDQLPKALLTVGELTLLERCLRQLRSFPNVGRINVITGHQAHRFNGLTFLNEVNLVHYHKFNFTNNFATLGAVKHLITRDTVVMFSDLIFETKVVAPLFQTEIDQSLLLVDTGSVREGTMRVKLNSVFEGGERRLMDIGSHIDVCEGDGNFIGIAKFNRSDALRLKEILGRYGSETLNQCYYTEVFRMSDHLKESVRLVDVSGLKWAEIDTPDDLFWVRKDFSGAGFAV